MTGVTLRVDLDDGGLGDALAQMIARGEDLTPAMDSIGMGLEASIIERFNETSIAPSGAAWQPSKAAQEEGRRTLIKSGNLRDSITHLAARDEVEVGSNVIYAAIHQFGGTIKQAARRQTLFFRQNSRTGEVGSRFVKKGRSNFAQDAEIGAREINMPARPFLGVSDSDREMIRAELVAFITGGAA